MSMSDIIRRFLGAKFSEQSVHPGKVDICQWELARKNLDCLEGVSFVQHEIKSRVKDDWRSESLTKHCSDDSWSDARVYSAIDCVHHLKEGHGGDGVTRDFGGGCD